jgi:hypothetical protein
MQADSGFAQPVLSAARMKPQLPEVGETGLTEADLHDEDFGKY